MTAAEATRLIRYLKKLGELSRVSFWCLNETTNYIIDSGPAITKNSSSIISDKNSICPFLATMIEAGAPHNERKREQ